MPSATNACSTMRAAQASAFGSADDVLTVTDGVSRPSAPAQGQVTIRVYACSLSPGDYRMLSGDGKLFKKPSSWPYIPGGDVAGVVVALHPDLEKTYAVGDRVIGTWDGFGVGGLAEYTNVSAQFVEKIPPSLSFIDAAALADSSVNAMLATEDIQLQSSDSLLIIGGSGGVGTALIQLARHIGVKDIVAVSTDEELLTRLGASVVVNYRTEPWWAAKEITSRAPFDVLIDCAEGSKAWEKVCQLKLVKSASDGGRFLGVVVNDWHIIVHRWLDLASFLIPPLQRTISSRIWRCQMPQYNMMWPAPRGDSLQRLLRLVEDGALCAVIHNNEPLPFTTEGVRKAFDIMVNRRAHGKVVVKIADDE